MNCAKCGRELQENAPFCGKCLAGMEAYPVKPGTVIQLPQRAAAPSKKSAPRRKSLPPEELVVRQRKTIRWLALAVFCLVLLLGLSVALLFRVTQDDALEVAVGQEFITRDSAQ